MASPNPLNIGMLALCGLLLGEPADAATLERVSVSSDEVEGNGESYYPSVSDDGRFVAFCSFADNLVPGDTNGAADVFVRDRLNGTTERISVSSDEAQANGESCGPHIAVSADGRFVAFTSSATNLVVGDNNSAEDAFVRDRQAGATELVSVSSQEEQASFGARAYSISADGRFVVFDARLERPPPQLVNKRIHIRDRQLGTTETTDEYRWSQLGDRGPVGNGAFNANRRFFATYTHVGGRPKGAEYDIRFRDRLNRTEEVLAFVDDRGGGDLTMSADGRFLSLYHGGERGQSVLDRKSGVRKPVGAGAYPDAPRGPTMKISANGRFLMLSGQAEECCASPAEYDFFVRDLLTNTTEQLTDDPTSLPPYPFGILSISADGSFVALASDAASLVPGDTNNTFDVFVSEFVREHRELPDGRNDLVVAPSGRDGIQQFVNNRDWVKIDNASTSMLAAGDLDGDIKDEVIAGIPGRGLVAGDYKTGLWHQLHRSIPQRLVVGDFDGNGLDDLAADFGIEGLWVRVNEKPWVQVHAYATKGLKAGDLDGDGKDDLIANFGPDGLWARYNNATWIKLQSGSPVRLATGDLDGNGQDELIAEFGRALFALYNNDPPFVRLPNGPTQGLATGDLDGNGRDELLADFGSRGLFAYYNNTAPWVRLDPRSPTSLIATDLDQDGKEDVVGDFGAAGLLVRYNNAGAFRQIHQNPSRAIAAGGFYSER